MLIKEFQSRYSVFSTLNLAFNFLKNPFVFENSFVENFSAAFDVKKTHLEFDILLIQMEISISKEKSEIMWNRLLENSSFLVLQKIVPKFLCTFGSTYVCKCTFSNMKHIKFIKIQNCL